MEAGRELDALIAEKVMGIEMPAPFPVKLNQDDPLDRAIGMVYTGAVLRAMEPKPYSTDIAAAKEVQAVLEKSWSVAITKDRITAEYICELYAHEDLEKPRPDVCEGAETEALAICLAALKVFGE